MSDIARMLRGASREATVINALRVVAHTRIVDPEFFNRCVGKIKDVENDPNASLLEQNEQEFSSLLTHLTECRSVLEIGSRYGESIKRIAMAIQPRSRVVSVDLMVKEEIGKAPDPEPRLRATMAELGRAGYDAHLFIGDSHGAKLVAAVQALGPYDFCFIDGDHSYEGMKADWENFGPHAKIVAFHDIINNPECFRFWSEVRANHRTIEYTSSTWLGIGIVFKDGT